MDDRQVARTPDNVRASDKDRQQVVEQLQTAMADGRLKMDEYMERMEQAYEAVTYGDLARLQTDLPAVSDKPKAPAPAKSAAVAQPAARGGWFASLPTPLKVLWTIWMVPVFVNVVVWILVSAGSHHLVYPWPVWVAGPFGAVLLAVSLGVQAIRSGHKS
jgi:hypothetical protein